MLIEACGITSAPRNTGNRGCNMKATALIILCPQNAKWQDSDNANFSTFLNTQFHASAPTSRFYPIFGKYLPLQGIAIFCTEL